MLCLVLAVAVCLVYSNTFRGPFQYDDYNDIRDNPAIRHLWPPWRIFFLPGNGFATRPVGNLAFAINYAIGAFNPFSYHLANLGIHLAASLALLGVVRRTLSLPHLNGRFAGHIPTLALVIAVLWALHPLQTESVSYITQRYESLMGLFSLLTFYCTLRAAESLGPVKWEALAALSCLLALGSKEVAVSIPILVLLFDCIFLSGSFQEAWRRRKVLYLGLLVAWACFAFVQLYGVKRSWAGAGPRSETLPWWLYALNQPAVILHYLRLSLWPYPLNFDYYWPVERLWIYLMPSLAAVGTLLGLTVWGIVRFPKMAFLSVCFFFILAPTSSVMPILDLAVEHRMYLPLAPVIAGCVIGFYWIVSHNPVFSFNRVPGIRLVIAVSIACALSVLGILTYLRNEDYQDPVDIWRTAVLQSPHNPRAHHNYAFHLQTAGFFDEAIRQYAISVEQAPYMPLFHSNYGVLLGKLGRTEKALEHLRKAVELDPKEYKYVVNLGVGLWQKGSADNALICFQEASKINPLAAIPYHSMAFIRLTKGQTSDALKLVRQATAVEPENPSSQYILGLILLKIGDRAGARIAFQKSIALEVDQPNAASKIAWACHQFREDEEAVKFLQQALSIKPDHTESQIRLAWILATSPNDAVRNGPVAVNLAQNLLKTQPFRSPRLLDLLAVSLAESGRFSEARGVLQEAIAQSKVLQDGWVPTLEERIPLFEKKHAFRDVQSIPVLSALPKDKQDS